MMKKLIYHSLLAVLCGAFLFGGWMVWKTQREYKAATDSFNDLAQYITIPDAPAVSAKALEIADEEDDTYWPEVDFEALQQLNPDVVGWIYIEGTAVNYPIVQAADNSYYLKRLVDGTINSSGSIYLDCDSESDFSGSNSVIYGHNMKNGTMFRTVMSYKKQAFYDEHPVALLMTPGGNYKIRFFSGYVADLSDSAWDLFFADDTYGQWLEEIAGRSCFASNVVPEEMDRVVTLSTCSYEFDNARFVLHGIIE